MTHRLVPPVRLFANKGFFGGRKFAYFHDVLNSRHWHRELFTGKIDIAEKSLQQTEYANFLGNFYNLSYFLGNFFLSS